jgi:hypothetical protein
MTRSLSVSTRKFPMMVRERGDREIGDNLLWEPVQDEQKSMIYGIILSQHVNIFELNNVHIKKLHRSNVKHRIRMVESSTIGGSKKGSPSQMGMVGSVDDMPCHIHFGSTMSLKCHRQVDGVPLFKHRVRRTNRRKILRWLTRYCREHQNPRASVYPTDKTRRQNSWLQGAP